MIVLDNDILVKWGGRNPDPEIISHLQHYRHEEWAIPAIVAFEFYKSCKSRVQMNQVQSKLHSQLDRILDFSDDVAFEAAYLHDRLNTQNITLPPVDLLNLATAHAENATFITHNKSDFDKPQLQELTNVDIVHTTA